MGNMKMHLKNNSFPRAMHTGIVSLAIVGLFLSVASVWADDGKPAAKDDKLATGKLTDVLAPPKADGAGDAKPASDAIDVPSNEWTVRFIDTNPSRKPKVLPPDSGLKVLKNLPISGGGAGNPHLLSQLNPQSEWFIQEGYLMPADKTDSALRIARVEDFELQGIWNAEGRGGWYILLGYNDGHGYVLENTQFISKESGSPWHITELRGGEGIDDTFRKVCHEHRFEWKKDQPVRLKVDDQKLSLKVGDEQLIDEEPIPNYSAGELVIGTFKGRYEPKPLKFRSLRIRAGK